MESGKAKKSGEPAQLVHCVRFRDVHQPFEARHVVKHLTQDSKVIVAVADELLHLGIDHRGNLELFPGEIHGWTYIRSGQTQLQPLRKFSSSSVRLPSVPATPTWASSAV